MEIKDMNREQVEARMAEIEELLKGEDPDVEALKAEVDELEARKAAITAAAEEKRALLEKVANSNIAPVDSVVFEGRKDENMEKEQRAQMIDALAEYIKGRATEEQRALLLSENVSGTVAISKIVDDWIWTDWDASPILSRIRKVYVQGNYAVQYETSATGAVKHTEGQAAPDDETLVLGTINFVASYFKKWIKVSDTVLALRGQFFLDYLMREFGHQLAIALENAVVAEIESSSLAAAVTNPIDNTAAMAGFAALSDEATKPVVIISKANYAAIMNERTTGGEKIIDPFNGMEVLFNNTVTGMLVGDLDGVVANFPEGEDFKFIVDDRSLAESDLVKIVGKVLCDLHLVRPNGFAVVTAE